MTADSSSTSTAAPNAASTFDADALSLSLTVRDVKASVAWYVGVVGFKVQREIEREGKLVACSMSAGTARILVNQDDGSKGMDRKKGEGMSFMLTTRQSIDEVAKHIKDHGGKLETEPADMPWGARVFRMRDPDGFVFSVSTPVF